MYRARVEAVDGLRVRAGGKWLTCIGNRVVRAGDIVWTDGRCVYGHDREAQTPLVIVNPEPKEAIPVQIGNELFTFYKDTLRPVEQSSEEQILESKERILNNARKNTYILTASAANCTNSGDIYTIDAGAAASTLSYHIPISNAEFFPVDTNPVTESKFSVSIKKNGTVVKKVPLHELLQKSQTQTLSEAQALPHGNQLPDNYNPYNQDGRHYWDGVLQTFYSQEIVGRMVVAFIENPDSWAFIYCASIFTDKVRNYVVNNEADNWGDPPYTPLYDISDGYSILVDYYYIDSSGKCSSIYQCHQIIKVVPSGYYIGKPWAYGDESDSSEKAVTDSVDSSAMQGIKFPLQDGYYCMLTVIPSWKNDPSRKRWWERQPDLNYAIYSPNDKLLFNYEEPFGAKFTISKLSSNKYLVGIDYAGPFPHEPNPEFIKSKAGLYICKSGNLEPLTSTGKNFGCRNYRLRPMKKWRHWWEHIQTIE